MDIIADYPAYTIFAEDPNREFVAGDVFAIPYQSRHHGTLWHFFTLGSVEDYALKYGEDPAEAVARATAFGHKLYWANPNSVSITAWERPKEIVPGKRHGDVIKFKGRNFRLDPDHNDNIKLTPVIN